MHRLVRCKNERRCSRTHGADVSFRDVTIRIPDRGYNQGREWYQAPELWAEIWEKWVEFCLGRTRLIFASSLVSGAHVVWDRWKSQHRKIVYLSPHVEKPFNSKVIRSFVPEQRSRKCFSCFGSPMFYVYMLWTFYERFTYPYHGCVTALRSALHGMEQG